MRALLKILILAPIALLILAISLANRHLVTISLDPIGAGDGALPQFPIPLYIVLLASVMIGVILGGFSTWVGQSRLRSAARSARNETSDLRAENEMLRGQIAALKPTSSSASLSVVRSVG
jgi:uncharacterized integral membrane protein